MNTSTDKTLAGKGRPRVVRSNALRGAAEAKRRAEEAEKRLAEQKRLAEEARRNSPEYKAEMKRYERERERELASRPQPSYSPVPYVPPATPKAPEPDIGFEIVWVIFLACATAFSAVFTIAEFIVDLILSAIYLVVAGVKKHLQNRAHKRDPDKKFPIITLIVNGRPHVAYSPEYCQVARYLYKLTGKEEVCGDSMKNAIIVRSYEPIKLSDFDWDAFVAEDYDWGDEGNLDESVIEAWERDGAGVGDAGEDAADTIEIIGLDEVPLLVRLRGYCFFHPLATKNTRLDLEGAGRALVWLFVVGVAGACAALGFFIFSALRGLLL